MRVIPYVHVASLQRALLLASALFRSWIGCHLWPWIIFLSFVIHLFCNQEYNCIPGRYSRAEFIQKEATNSNLWIGKKQAHALKFCSKEYLMLCGEVSGWNVLPKKVLGWMGFPALIFFSFSHRKGHVGTIGFSPGSMSMLCNHMGLGCECSRPAHPDKKSPLSQLP